MLNFSALFQGKKVDNQLTQIVRQKPALILTTAFTSLLGSIGLYWKGFSLIGVSALGGISLASFFKLGKEYQRFINHRAPFVARSFSEDTVTSFLTGERLASLHYENDLPVVVFSENATPRERGYAIAKLSFGPSLELLDRYVAWVPTFIKLLQKKWFGLFSDPIQEVAENMAHHQFIFSREDDEYIAGIVDGINEGIKNENKMLFLPHKQLTIEDFKRIICTYDTFKLMACTSGIRTNKTQDGTKMIRNLEWPSAGMLGQSTIATVTPVNQGTNHPVQRVFSIGVVPDLGGFTLANNQRLVISLNEAATTATKRNHVHGIPQFLLSKKIAANCSTIEEVKAFLAHNPPATTHSLTIMDKHGHGAVFQMLPPGRSAMYTMRTLERKGYVHIANHFLDNEGYMMQGSLAWPNSPKRHQCMGDYLEKVPYVKSSTVADKAADVDCVHSLLFSSKVNKFKLKARWGNMKDSMDHQAEIDLNRVLALRP